MLYLTVGMLGYMYALDGTCGSILENLPKDDWLVHVGRAGLILTLLLSFPLLVLPCRRAIQRVLFTPPVNNSLDGGVEVEAGNVVGNAFDETMQLQTPSPEQEKKPIANRDRTGRVFHTVATILIVVTALVTALFVPGIEQVWTFVGATVGIGIAFILPTAIYIMLRGRHLARSNARRVGAILLLALSIIFSVVCTAKRGSMESGALSQ